jgi:uncharacterized SAM-binding protein YcdF (DUF218 family)
MVIAMDFFVVLKFLSNVIFPPASTAAGVLLGLVLTLRFPRTGRALIALSILQTIVLSLPIVADFLMAPLEEQARSASRQADPCCYGSIVVLGGGIIPPNPPAMPTAHLIDGADRLIYAAKLYHDGIAPLIIASGGAVPRTEVNPGESEAMAMKSLLVRLGVPSTSIVLESRSSNTLENIAFVRELAGSGRVALVTSAYHMPRAMEIARRLDLDASAFPTDWRVPWALRSLWHNWLPTADAEGASTIALREYLAIEFDRRVPGK